MSAYVCSDVLSDTVTRKSTHLTARGALAPSGPAARSPSGQALRLLPPLWPPNTVMPGLAHPLLSSCAAPGSSPGVFRASFSVEPAMRWVSTWMVATPPDLIRGAGMTTRGSVPGETAPHHESGIRRSLDLMWDSPGLGGIRRDKVGSSETSGIPRQRCLPESRPSARPTFPSSRTQRAWTLRRAP